MYRLLFKPFLLFVILGSLMACSSLPQQKESGHQPLTLEDPFEGFNRGVYKFNRGADKLILKPVAKAYDTVLPDPAKTGVANFFDNLSEPLNIVNNALQGKWEGSLKSTYRFMVNSTIGLFGLFDVASQYEVEEAEEDFGQTLAAWGVKPGPYTMVPFLGPTTFRDGFADLGTAAVLDKYSLVTSDSAEQFGLRVTEVVDIRRQLLPTDKLLDNQIDEYSFIRGAYYANRLNKVYDGNPPKSEAEDINDF